MKTAKLSISLLAASALTLSACGTPQNFGVGRNPLGSNLAETVKTNVTPSPVRAFNGNPEDLRALFLRPIENGKLTPGSYSGLEVIAVDGEGRLIDPSKLSLKFSSSKPDVVRVDSKGVLMGIMPFESSIIRVEDTKTKTSAQAEFTVSTPVFLGNPRSLASLQLVLRDQVTPGQNETAQFEIIARDALGNAIDPSKLKLDWTVGDTNLFKIDDQGKVTALTATGQTQVTVRDAVTGRVVTGTVKNLFNKETAPPAQNSNNSVTDIPKPIPSGNPGTPVNPTSPSQGNSNPLPLPSANTGTPASAASITLTPAVTYLPVGDRAQLNVSILDNQGNPINPNTLNLQWVSQDSDIPVDQTGTVTANRSNGFSRVTVSIPGTNLSASAFVNTLPAQSSGGGGGGGGGSTVNPSAPSTYSSPLSTTSFKVHVTEPVSTPTAIVEYVLTIGNAPGEATFTIPYAPGTVTFDVPAEANLDPDTTYPYSIVARTSTGRQSAVVNAFGTTLQATLLAPTNLIGGSKDFSGVIPGVPNTQNRLSRALGNGLGAGDNSSNETLTVTFEPTQANFGTVSLVNSPALPAGVNVSGGGVQGDPLVISGPKADVDLALDNFAYTPANGFTGNATVTMTSTDQVEGVATPDDVDTLVFSINSATATPPQNLMNSVANFADLITAVDTPVNLRPLSNSELSVNDPNGDTLTTVLTPANGTLALVSIPAGVTVTGNGTSASPLQLVGPSFYINSALSGGLIFTPNTGFTGTGTVHMVTTAPDGSDTDTVDINVIQPSNLFNGATTFPTTPQRMAQSTPTTLDGAVSKALTVLYPPSSNVRVNLVLLDAAGNNPGEATNGSLALVGSVPGTVTVTNPGPEGPGSLQLEGPVADVNSLLTAGVLYSPQGSSTGTYRLRMNSVDTANNALTDTNDVVILEVSAIPQNRFANNPNGFPPIGNPIELGFNTPLTFASFFNTALSVVDNDSTSVTTTLTPSSNGKLTRANNSAVPTGVTVSNGTLTLNAGDTDQIEGTQANPLVITGSPSAINSFLNNGLVFTPTVGFSGAATVTINTHDGGGQDTDVVHINVLSSPENLRDNNATFSTTAIQAAPGVEVDMGVVANRLSVRNYPASNSNVEVVLSVPVGKGSLRINGVAGTTGTLSSVSVSGNTTRELTLIGSQSNLNTVLQSLRYTPDAASVASPETVNITMNSNGGTLGDTGDLVPIAISNPPRNIYNTQDADETSENASFPGSGNRLSIFGNQTLIFNNTATATQPQVRLDVLDDSPNVEVTLRPANTAGNTAAAFGFTTPPTGVNATGAGTHGSPLVISGPTAAVKTAMELLNYTPQTGFTGNTSFDIISSDFGPANDTNTVEMNILAKVENTFNGSTTFPGTQILIIAGTTNPFQDSGLNTTIHELGLVNLASYNNTGTATVQLSVPASTVGVPTGTLSVTASGGVTVTGNGTNTVTLSATGANIPNLATVVDTLVYSADALGTGVNPATVVLTMTHGPNTDTDTLNLLATRAPVNLFNATGTTPDLTGNNFPTAGSPLVVNEGTPLVLSTANNNAITVGSAGAPNLGTEDSTQITVTLTPTTGSGTLDFPNGTVGVTVGGTAPVVTLTGSPANVNTVLANGVRFTPTAGFNSTATLRIDSTDGAARDLNDLVNLDVRALPANRFNGSNTFPGTGSPISVGLNTPFALNAANNRALSVNFYQSGDTVTVDLSLNPNTGTLSLTGQATASGTVSSVNFTGNNTGTLQLVGSQANVNTVLNSLVYNSVNAAGTIDLTMTSTNGTVGDTGTEDVLRFSVQNSTPVNSLTGTNSGFNNSSGNAPLPLRTVSDTTTVEDRIDFGQGDTPALVSGGALTVTGNTWPTLSVADDNTTVTTTLTPPNFGSLSDRLASNFSGLGLTSVSGSGTNASPLVLSGTPAQINTALLRLRFTPSNGVANGTSGNLVINTSDGTTSDTDNIAILVERPNLPDTFNSNPNPSGTVFRAVYQLGRDKLPQIVVNDITISADEVANGAQIQIVRYNDNDPTTTADDDTTLLRTVTLNNPNASLGESVSFNNQTNRATVTVDFSASGAPLLSTGFKDGTGKVGGVLTGGNIDNSVTSSTAAANHPFDFFVFPDRAQYAVEDYFSGANNRGRWYLINTSTSSATGLGRLSMIFDSNGALSLENGRNATQDVTTGLAKNPVNGDVYYVDDNASSNGALIRWIPSRGIQNDRGGSNSATDPFLRRGNLSVNNGTGTTYNFNDKPARLVFNATVSGGITTPILYASSGFVKNDGTGNLSGFYRLTGFEGADTTSTTAVTEQNIRLMVNDGFGGFEELGLNQALTNSGDLTFEPDTDPGAGANNHMLLTTANRLYVSREPVPSTGTADVIMDSVDLSPVINTLRHDGTPGGILATDFVGLSIDGEWTSGNRSFLVIARYPGAQGELSRLYRVSYTLTPSATPATTPTTLTVTGATLLTNGNFGSGYPATSFNPAGPIPLVDITSAHKQ